MRRGGAAPGPLRFDANWAFFPHSLAATVIHWATYLLFATLCDIPTRSKKGAGGAGPLFILLALRVSGYQSRSRLFGNGPSDDSDRIELNVGTLPSRRAFFSSPKTILERCNAVFAGQSNSCLD